MGDFGIKQKTGGRSEFVFKAGDSRPKRECFGMSGVILFLHIIWFIKQIKQTKYQTCKKIFCDTDFGYFLKKTAPKKKAAQRG